MHPVDVSGWQEKKERMKGESKVRESVRERRERERQRQQDREEEGMEGRREKRKGDKFLSHTFSSDPSTPSPREKTGVEGERGEV